MGFGLGWLSGPGRFPCHPLLGGGALRQLWRHQGLGNLRAPTFCARQLLAFGLPLVGRATGKPGVEFVAFLHFEALANKKLGFVSAIGRAATSNGRSCWSEGMRWRACVTSAQLRSATMTEV